MDASGRTLMETLGGRTWGYIRRVRQILEDVADVKARLQCVDAMSVEM